MIANYIGLHLSNPYWNALGGLVKNELGEYINIPKCIDNNLNQLFEPDAHTTIIYSDELTVGPNWLYWYITLKDRELFRSFQNKILNIDPVIDTFDNVDCRVLKFNLNLTPGLEPIYELNSNLVSDLNLPKKDYNPHVTITYLNPDTPDSVIDKFVSELDVSKFTEFKLDRFEIGTGDRNQNLIINL